MRGPTLRTAVLVAAFACAAGSLAGQEGGTTRAVDGIRADLDRGDVDGAIARGEAAAAAAPGDSETWLWLGRAYGRKAQSASVFSKVGFAKKCQAAFEKAVALDPRNIDAREDLLSYYGHAPGIIGGSTEKAREQAAAIARLDTVRGHVATGWVLVREKDYAGAEAQFMKALQAEPTGSRGAVALGNFYVGQKRWADARALWQRRLDANPAGDALARFQIARVAYFSGNDLEEGVGHLRAYLSAPSEPGLPTWADAHWRLGLLYEKLGRRDDAAAELREALKLVPGHVQAKKDLERIQK